MMDNTLTDRFHKWEKEYADSVFLRQPSNSHWKNYTWAEVGVQARIILGALQSIGVQSGDRVAILSANCAEWIVCDLALMMGGIISVPLYANVNSKALKKILEDSGVRSIFVGKLRKSDWLEQKDSIPDHIQKVSMNGFENVGTTPWNNFIGNTIAPNLMRPRPEDVMTIIYTSGTTGDPKGVVHTYDSIFKALSVASHDVHYDQRGNRFASYLPLSHAAERGLVEAGAIFCGGTISFIHSLDSFAENIQAIQPTHFFGVPRIWEKFQKKILEQVGQKKLDILLRIPLVSSFLKNKIKKSLGLNKAIVIISGAAPISPKLIRWFLQLDIVIREGYGLSENFNVISLNPEKDIRIGTVGKLFPDQDVIIDPSTKEILQKASWLMKEYHNRPEQTKETLIDGYLHTGDMGALSEDGFLSIIGRVKDIFKTAKGEYIAPAPIEEQFLDLDIVDQACVLGSKYPQPFILIVLSEGSHSYGKTKVISDLKDCLQKVNSSAMEYQQLKKAIVVKEEWTIENDLLTPTLKMKRNLIQDKYELAMQGSYLINEVVSWEQ